MPPEVFGLVLVAALMHAAWNAVVKASGDKTLTAVMVAAAAAIISLPIMPFLAIPARESWPFLALSVALQVAYYFLVARAYTVADMSQTYPVMRGTAPLIVTLVGMVLLGEHLGGIALSGIFVIAGGILSMALWSGGSTNRAGLRYALLNAFVIAGYTLSDGYGARLSGAPVSYTMWEFVLTAAPMLAWALLRRRSSFLRQVREGWHWGLLAGFGTLVSYAVALWAMTLAPVAVVAALRETSILFGTAIAAFILRERIGPQRLVAACMIAVGAGLLRLA
ncbi:membrane protein [Haematobacter missouriensis]|uniref:EamA family transporter n=1 Tax=Haematobacter missouriensis TaxID=366616 RepID=A0A212AJM1_9RHOB|nr:EamA family transporter [Haematobacter missouriensis]KFI32802.1 membrane protein [Haematobacter missouriensis]OWJ77439.1 EamA family transporter [Haematobacter missouriensis]OWJ81633.1 EamA family transporter [Haematobacter missouriensis]